MDRRPTSALLSWLLLPVAAYLVQSAVSIPSRANTGLALRGDLVASVDPASPALRAGLAAGDRVRPVAEPGRPTDAPGSPLRSAVPGRPIDLERDRQGQVSRVWLAPEPLSDGERRFQAALLAVVSVFVLLGGWVWSERRDALARMFFLLCISFACLLAPPPRVAAGPANLVTEIVISGITLYTPALFIHFFALFPESHARGRRGVWVKAAYLVASLLFSLALVVVAIENQRGIAPSPLADVLQAAAGIWFAFGLLTAVALFVASYANAGSPDARRRLRVALIGAALGLGPFAALTALRNLLPAMAMPGERGALALILLVPATFAWAIVVHRIFDFRVALRAGVVTALVAALGLLAYAVGEGWTRASWPGLGSGLSGGALAFVALAASLAGPAAPLLRSVGSRIVPDDRRHPLMSGGAPAAGAMPFAAAAPGPNGDVMLVEACAAVVRSLRLDGCLALVTENGSVRPVSGRPAGALSEPPVELSERTARLPGLRLQSVEDSPLEAADREALAIGGVAWLLPIGESPRRALLLLGRRLAGPWLSRHEVGELERFADHLAVSLENATLRREASSHGALARELREAGVIQAHLLPQRVPVHPTLDCAAAVMSSEAVGGDYYDFVQGADRAFMLAVGDAAGKGMPAALLLAHVQARFRSEASRHTSPGSLLGTLNRELVGLDQPEKFMGLMCARVDVRLGRVWIANGGITPPLVCRGDGRVEAIETGGVLLGVSPDARYPDACVDLNQGDVLVVHTDGLTEARRDDDLYGPERVRAILQQEHGRRAADILAEILRAVRAYTDRPLDDLTVVVLKQLTRTGRAERFPSQSALKSSSSADDHLG